MAGYLKGYFDRLTAKNIKDPKIAPSVKIYDLLLSFVGVFLGK
jgi:hypothetical protein